MDFNKTKSKGFQFGVAREKMWQTGIFGGVKQGVPGPGKYELPSTLTKQKWSMRPKTHDDLMVSNKYVPGPGTYPHNPTINDKGRYPQSKHSNSCATLFNPPRSKRFQDLKGGNAPGPGNYALDNTGIQKVMASMLRIGRMACTR